MPRKDGFPTNRELQVDFTAGAHAVYLRAAQRQLEADPHPAYIGKPLDHLSLVISRKYDIPEDSSRISNETLEVTPLSPNSANFFGYPHGNELFRDTSPETIQYYQRIAEAMATTVVTDAFRFGSIPQGGIDAHWTAVYQYPRKGSRTRHASSFKERPSKMSLASAKGFVEDAREYVESDVFTQDMLVRMMDYASGYTEDNPRYGMHHRFQLCIAPSLPLNGYESQGFLRHYRDEMARRLVAAEERLKKLEYLGAAALILEHATRIQEGYRDAVQRAEGFLGDEA